MGGVGGLIGPLLELANVPLNGELSPGRIVFIGSKLGKAELFAAATGLGALINDARPRGPFATLLKGSMEDTVEIALPSLSFC